MKVKGSTERNKEEVISQIPKLTNCFSSTRQSANISKNKTANKNVEILIFKENKTFCENVFIEQFNPILENKASIEEEKNNDSKLHKLNTENTNTIENKSIVESDISNFFIGFENDVGI